MAGVPPATWAVAPFFCSSSFVWLGGVFVGGRRSRKATKLDPIEALRTE